MKIEKLIADIKSNMGDFMSGLFKKEHNSGKIENTINSNNYKGEIRSIRRTSGGVSIAQVIRVFHKDKRECVEVRFKDISHKNNQLKYFLKVLLVDELMPPFEFDVKNEGIFAADFGNGLIPIHVFRFEEVSGELKWAYFIELAYAEKRTKKAIKIYRIDPLVLRFIPTGKDFNSVEYTKIMERYYKLKEAKRRLIPKEFIFGNPIDVPIFMDKSALNRYLDALVSNKVERGEDTLAGTIKGIKEYFIDDKLVPFGALEPTKTN